jgi:hypothetical protein
MLGTSSMLTSLTEVGPRATCAPVCVCGDALVALCWRHLQLWLVAAVSHPRYLLDVLAGPTATAAHKNKERIRISLSLRRKIKTNPENRTEDEE